MPSPTASSPSSRTTDPAAKASKSAAKRGRTVTMQQVAVASGVSQGTVSQVLNGKGDGHRIATETQQRVRDAADRLGYRRNQSARSMRLGRSNAVGFLVASDHQFFGFSRHPRLVRGLAVGLNEYRNFLRLVVLDAGEQDPDVYLKQQFSELGVDGLVVSERTRLGDRLEAAMDRYRFPSIWANVLREHDCVIPDETAAIQALVREFAELGHRHIGYYDSGVNSHFSSVERREAFDRMTNHGTGIRGSFVDVGHELPPQAKTAELVDYFAAGDWPTAWIVVSGTRGQTLLWAARECGLS
ncbi:MAG: LacI family DNA-binding transcriptional regulator, partial [Planctomycetota bacterium]